MGRSFNYDDRPEAQYVPLRADEVEALIMNGGKIFSQDGRRIVHLLHRVATTIREQGARIAALQADVERIRVERAASSHPMARAVQAISELNDDEKRQLLDDGYLRELARLEKATEEAELTKLGVLNESNRIRHALAGMLEDPDVPSETKQHVRVVLTRIGYPY
jgi:hypothetical protein